MARIIFSLPSHARVIAGQNVTPRNRETTRKSSFKQVIANADMMSYWRKSDIGVAPSPVLAVDVRTSISWGGRLYPRKVYITELPGLLLPSNQTLKWLFPSLLASQ